MGTNVRPLFSTESSVLESVWDDKLITWYLALNVSGALLCNVLWLYLVNLRVCLSRLGAGCGWWVGWAGGEAVF